MNYTKNLFLPIGLVGKLKYLEVGTIFSRTTYVEIRQTFASISYVKTIQLGDSGSVVVRIVH